MSTSKPWMCIQNWIIWNLISEIFIPFCHFLSDKQCPCIAHGLQSKASFWSFALSNSNNITSHVISYTLTPPHRSQACWRTLCTVVILIGLSHIILPTNKFSVGISTVSEISTNFPGRILSSIISWWIVLLVSTFHRWFLLSKETNKSTLNINRDVLGNYGRRINWGFSGFGSKVVGLTISFFHGYLRVWIER